MISTRIPLPFDLPIFLLLLCFHSPVPHIELNLSRHERLPLPTRLISPRTVMNIPDIFTSESLQNAPLPTFE